MKYFVYSEPGTGHTNEDFALAREHSHSRHALFCAVADGQGGRSGGAAAARMAVEHSIGTISPTVTPNHIIPELWYILVNNTDENIAEDDDAGFTTLVALFVNERKLSGVSCGDSAALLVQDGKPLWLTENQRKNPPIGSSSAFPVVFEAELHAPWKLLLLTDGVWRYVGYDAVARIAAEHSGEALIAALRRTALDGNGGNLGDDFTVVLVQPG